jgi:hypothetical protein
MHSMRVPTLRQALLLLTLVVGATLLVGGIGKLFGWIRETRMAAARTKRINDIKTIYAMYYESQIWFMGPPRTPPKQASDLTSTAVGQNSIDASAALTDGSFIFIYRVNGFDMQDQGGASQLVLGYEPQAATDEGFVLMGDGEVKYVTAEEFKTLPKAEALHWRESATFFIGMYYRQFLEANPGKVPTQVSDLVTETGWRDDIQDANKALNDGSFVFIYGVTPADMDKQGDPSQLVLGYEREAATDKGYVLMGDGKTRYVTAAEFKTIRQAKPGKN